MNKKTIDKEISVEIFIEAIKKCNDFNIYKIDKSEFVVKVK